MNEGFEVRKDPGDDDLLRGHDVLEALAKLPPGSDMSQRAGILPDFIIDSLCRNRKMIDPYVDHQVKENGQISYGLSSYGYDARVGTEFKVFTNVNSAIVDPKNFSDDSFVEREGDYCIIPPNSFVLARTVEYFRIPRDVLVVCLGKSTYARCFSGDTKVALVDGRNLSFLELIDGVTKGERFWGYTIKADGTIGVEELKNPRKIGSNEELVAVELDDGTVIRCTPDHEFMLKDGSYRKAEDLREDDSLMPLYQYEARGYEVVYCPSGVLRPTHRLADDWNVANGIYTPNVEIDEHRHHVDFNRRNNNPINIARLEASEHLRLHNEHTWEGKDRILHSEAIRAALRKKYENAEELLAFCREQSRKAHNFWHEKIYVKIRDALSETRKKLWTTERRTERGEFTKKLWENGVFANRQPTLRRPDITASIVFEALKLYGSIKEAARSLDCSRQLLFRRFKPAIQQAQFEGYVTANHAVKSVTKLEEHEDVYCLEVPNTQNFALAGGVFVHNCGIVVNVTPLEPEWEGQVTLEFSNTTPLPAKLYSNEGACQFLFLRGAAACATSYADRKGKYQKQLGVTLPRVIRS